MQGTAVSGSTSDYGEIAKLIKVYQQDGWIVSHITLSQHGFATIYVIVFTKE